jgi:hypothetical protein
MPRAKAGTDWRIPTPQFRCANNQFLSRIKVFSPSGESILVFGNRVKPPEQKYFAFHFGKSEV